MAGNPGAYRALRRTLAPKQVAFLENSDAFLNVADGAIRAGKTHACLWRFAFHTQAGPPGDMMMLGRTRETVHRNAISPLRQMLGPKRVRYNRGTGELYVGAGANARLVWVVGINDAQAMAKILGSTLAGSYSNEMAMLRADAIAALWDRHSLGGAKMFGDTNPDSPYHWLNTDYLENEDLTGADLYRLRFSLADNAYLPPEYVARLLRRYPEGSLWRKRMVDGLWVMAEGTVYEGFDPELHVVGDDDLPTRFERVHVGVDHGTTNPTVFEAVGVLAGNLWVFAEEQHDPKAAGYQRTNGKHSWALRNFLRRVGERGPVVSVEVDPSAADFRKQLLEDGVESREAENAVLEGVRTVAELMAEGRLKIHDSCERLIREKGTYAWDRAAQQRGEDKPLKRDDHAVDAERYGIMGALAGGDAAAASSERSAFGDFADAGGWEPPGGGW
jgi:PBSX family phage terminase large subunit